MFETFGNKKGILNMVTRNWSETEAVEKARGIIDSVETVTFKDNRPTTGTNDDWFERNKASVERQIMQGISTAKATCRDCKKVLTEDEIKYFEGTCNDCEGKVDWYQDDEHPEELNHPAIDENIDFDNYRPVVDDDAEEYIPLSER